MSEQKEVFDAEQGHGNRLDSIAYEGEEERILSLIPDMLQKATVLTGTAEELPCSLGEDYPDRLKFVMLADNEGPLHLNMLIGCSVHGTHHELLSFYPELIGNEIPVVLTAIHEWSNGVEATLEGTFCDGERNIAFFDTRYIARKGKYEIGKTCRFRLAALAETCEILKERTFSFEGRQAVDFRAKLGEEAEYDENGNVKPVVFDLSEMVAFLQSSVAYPHVAEFQSPAAEVEVLNAWDREYYSIGINIGGEDRDAVRIPLLAKKTFFGATPQPGDPIRGVALVIGYAV